jgi:hypothetical protein
MEKWSLFLTDITGVKVETVELSNMLPRVLGERGEMDELLK